MAEKKLQEKPLAHSIDIDKNESRHLNCVICCACTTAILLILVTTAIILMVTIFHFKDPVLIFSMSNIEGLDVLNEAKAPSGLDLRSEAEVSIKNPNAASIKFNNTTTRVYYDDEAVSPAGQAEARKTVRMNVLIDIMVDKILVVSRLRDDLVAKRLPLSTYTRITGRVKFCFKRGM